MEIDERVDLSELLDLYGELLTPHQAEMLRLHCDCDISLFEISEQTGISRQAVRDALVRGERTLRSIEEKLGMKSRLAEADRIIGGIVEDVRSGNLERAEKSAEKLREALTE